MLMLEIQNTKLQTHVEYMTKTCSPTHRPNAHGETEYEFATQMKRDDETLFVHRTRKAMEISKILCLLTRLFHFVIPHKYIDHRPPSSTYTVEMFNEKKM